MNILLHLNYISRKHNLKISGGLRDKGLESSVLEGSCVFTSLCFSPMTSQNEACAGLAGATIYHFLAKTSKDTFYRPFRIS